MTGLRTSMFLYGGLLMAFGFLAMLFPGRLIEFAGRQATNTFLLGSWGWLTALLGLGILLAGRDPVRHILWVRLGLLSFAVGGAYDLLHYGAGTVPFGVVAPDLASYLLFGTLFLLFYPRAPRMVPLNVRVARGPLYTDIDLGGLFLRQGNAWVAYLLPARELSIAPPSATPSAPSEALPVPSEQAPAGPATASSEGRPPDTVAVLPEAPKDPGSVP